MSDEAAVIVIGGDSAVIRQIRPAVSVQGWPWK